MQSNRSQDNNNLILYWIENLVGNGPRFSFNLMVSIVGGILYSFNIWESPIALAIFGVVSPLLFTLCIYFLIRLVSQSPNSPFPKAFSSNFTSSFMMIFDMIIIIGLAVMIQTNIINYLFFRILQTIILPAIFLVVLRVLYIGTKHGEEE